MALRMAGLLTPPEPPVCCWVGVAEALAAVSDARALAIIAASALALCAALATEPLPLPTDAANDNEPDPVEATPSSAKIGCVTAPAPHFCFCLYTRYNNKKKGQRKNQKGQREEEEINKRISLPSPKRFVC